MKKLRKIIVQYSEISIIKYGDEDYISLTDMAKGFDGDYTIKNWFRNKKTIHFLGIWEQINGNINFNSVEFDLIKKDAGLPNSTLSVKQWANRTNSIGIISKTGRYNSGTYAHNDIAFEFGSWLSAEFKLYLIKEFQRLKELESQKESLEWQVRRLLAKTNYKIHTDSIKENLIPPKITKEQEKIVYANEADLLNVALFGVTAREWRQNNLDTKGNIRDEATIEQLIVLANLESRNAELIYDNRSSAKRLKKLNTIAIKQMKSLIENKSVHLIKEIS